MNFIGTRTFSKFVKIILDLFFVATIGFLVFSPKFATLFLQVRFMKETNYAVTTISSIFIFSSLAVLFVLHELRRIFKSINSSTPFTEANVKSLFRMGVASFLLALFFIFKSFVLQSLLTYVVILILIIAGCFSWVLSEVFRDALRVKEENDLTI